MNSVISSSWVGCASGNVYSGCRDRNECDNGSYAENTHNCVRSSNNGICMNNAGFNKYMEFVSSIWAGSFSCGSCSTSGTRYYGSSGTIKRFLQYSVWVIVCVFVCVWGGILKSIVNFFYSMMLLLAMAIPGHTARTQTNNGTLRSQQITTHRSKSQTSG